MEGEHITDEEWLKAKEGDDELVWEFLEHVRNCVPCLNEAPEWFLDVRRVCEAVEADEKEGEIEPAPEHLIKRAQGLMRRKL